jgi:hypothetical protein
MVSKKIIAIQSKLINKCDVKICGKADIGGMNSGISGVNLAIMG